MIVTLDLGTHFQIWQFTPAGGVLLTTRRK
jgi:hypothetical protein